MKLAVLNLSLTVYKSIFSNVIIPVAKVISEAIIPLFLSIETVIVMHLLFFYHVLTGTSENPRCNLLIFLSFFLKFLFEFFNFTLHLAEFH